MTVEKNDLTAKQKNAISNYLGKRLACYGVDSGLLTYEKSPRKVYSFTISQKLSQRNIGIFRHALKTCHFFGRIWDEKPMSVTGHLHFVECGLQYEHINGGTNGCDMNIKFYVDSNGKITEKYQ